MVAAARGGGAERARLVAARPRRQCTWRRRASRPCRSVADACNRLQEANGAIRSYAAAVRCLGRRDGKGRAIERDNARS